MATRFELVLHGEDPVSLRAAGEEALDEIERLERQLSLYRPDSDITRINNRAAVAPVRIDPQLFMLLQRARHLSLQTDGAFDITVAPLMRCWGFMGASGALPTPAAIDEARAKTGMHRLLLDEDHFTVQFETDGMMLDLGGIGKGYALERAATVLLENGITNALLHGGTSTICALGAPPDGTWKIAIPLPPDFIGLDRGLPERPPLLPSSARAEDRSGTPGTNPGPESVLTTVSLRNEALSVSAPHGKSFVTGEKTYGHVLDPRIGQPVSRASLAAVVLPSATDTDALSTALLVLGASGHQFLAARYPSIRTLIAAKDEATGEPQIQDRLALPDSHSAENKDSQPPQA